MRYSLLSLSLESFTNKCFKSLYIYRNLLTYSIAAKAVVATEFNLFIFFKPYWRHRTAVGSNDSVDCCRSSQVGLIVTTDYWWSLRGLEEGSEQYEDAINGVHQRSADRILQGCLSNGGLYIKLGQGLCSMDHVLPRQYILTLKVSLWLFKWSSIIIIRLT